MHDTEYEALLREAFLEHFDGLVDESGERNEDYEVPQYWQDGISEIAAESVPQDRSDLLQLWADLDFPEVDDTGLIEGLTDVVKIISWAVYEFASQELYELAVKYELND